MDILDEDCNRTASTVHKYHLAPSGHPARNTVNVVVSDLILSTCCECQIWDAQRALNVERLLR